LRGSRHPHPEECPFPAKLLVTGVIGRVPFIGLEAGEGPAGGDAEKVSGEVRLALADLLAPHGAIETETRHVETGLDQAGDVLSGLEFREHSQERGNVERIRYRVRERERHGSDL